MGDKKFSHPPPSLWPQITANQAFYSGFLHTYSKDFILRISFLGDKKCCHHFPHKSLPIGPFVRDIFKGILRILLKVDKKHCHPLSTIISPTNHCQTGQRLQPTFILDFCEWNWCQGPKLFKRWRFSCTPSPKWPNIAASFLWNIPLIYPTWNWALLSWCDQQVIWSSFYKFCNTVQQKKFMRN